MRKKRAVSAFLAAVILCGSMPFGVNAAEGSMTITDVQTHKAWDLYGSRYITYKVNGAEFDSRKTGGQFNLSVYRNMSESQKEVVARWMVNAGYRGRRAQFTGQGAVELMDKYDTVSGWKEAGQILNQRIENKYCKDLVQYYGSDDISDPNKFYKQECEKLTFPSDSAAAMLRKSDIVYADYPELNEFVEKYDAVQKYMKIGKSSYDCLKKDMVEATQYAVKGSSKEMISLICDKVLVPAITPSSECSTIGKEIFGAVLELGDRATNLSGELTDAVIGKAIDGEYAGNQIKKLTEMAEVEYDIAKTSHDSAVELYAWVNENAEKLYEKYKGVETNAKKVAQNKAESERTSIYEVVDDAFVLNEFLESDPYAYIDDLKPSPLGWYASQEDIEKNHEQEAKYRKAYEDEVNKLKEEAEKLAAEENEAFENLLKTSHIDGKYVYWEERDRNSIGYDATNGYSEYRHFSMGYLSTGSDREYKFYGPDIVIKDPETDRTIMSSSSLTDMNPYNMKIIDYTDQALGAAEVIAKQSNDYYLDLIDKVETINSTATGMIKSYVPRIHEISVKEATLGRHRPEGTTPTNSTVCSTALARLLALIEDTDEETVEEIRGEMDSVDKCIEVMRERNRNEKQRLEQFVKTRLEFLDEYKKRFDDYIDTVEEEKKFIKTAPDFISEPLPDKNDPTIGEKIKQIDEFVEKLDEYEEKTDRAYISILDAKKWVSWADENEPREDKNCFYGWEDKVKDYYSDFGVEYYPELPDKYADEKGMYISIGNIGETKLNYDDYYYTARNARVFQSQIYGTDENNVSMFAAAAEVKNNAGNARRSAAAGTMLPAGWTENISNAENMRPIRGQNGDITDLSGEMTKLEREIINIQNSPGSYVPADGIEKTGEGVVIDGEVYDISMSEGQTRRLAATVTPSNASNTGIMWESLTPDIADVDKNGRVTAKANGTAIIRAWAEDCETEKIPEETPQEDLESYGYVFEIADYRVLPKYETEFRISVNDADNPVPPEELLPVFKYGDVTGDGDIAADDAATVLQKALVGTYKMPIQRETDDWKLSADVTGDGDIAADDAANVLQKALVRTYKMPVERK